MTKNLLPARLAHTFTSFQELIVEALDETLKRRGEPALTDDEVEDILTLGEFLGHLRHERLLNRSYHFIETDPQPIGVGEIVKESKSARKIPVEVAPKGTTTGSGFQDFPKKQVKGD